jgi:hypothetical protein
MSLWPEIRAAKDGVFWRPAATLLTVNGTGVPHPFGPGYPADLGRAMEQIDEGMYDWQPIGYPAAVFPMRDSVEIGRQEVIRQIQRRPPGTKLVLCGYSQGALVVDEVWVSDLLSPAGVLHDRLADVAAIITYGDPRRCPGLARGNAYAGMPTPKRLNGHVTGGIAGPNCLTPEQTPAFFLSFANWGDLYASAPVGDTPWTKETQVGHNQTIIYEAVLDFTGEDLLALAQEVNEIVTMPLVNVIPLVQAIWNGLTFAVQGMKAPHWNYTIVPAVRYLTGLAVQLRASDL